MNRSIQAEGAFGIIKQDHSFRLFLLCSKAKGPLKAGWKILFETVPSVKSFKPFIL